MANILLLGSHRGGVSGVRSILGQDGHRVRRLRSPGRWRDVERDERPELIVVALESPEAVLSVPGSPGRGFPAPLLFVDPGAEQASGLHLDDRLVDHIGSPFMSEDLLARVDALVRARRVVLRSGPPRASAAPARPGGSDGVLGRIRARLADTMGSRVPPPEKPLGPYLEVAARIAEWADRRDVFEPGHAERVAAFAAMIGEAFHLSDPEATALLRAAMLHDIGKVALPAEILSQKEPLREDQKRLIRTHPERGAALLRALERDEGLCEAILYHHEQPDGDGYYGKSAEDVPRSSSILGVAEAYDAMTSTRLEPPLSSQAALDRLREQRGSKYDADCVDALVDTLRPRSQSIPLSPRR